MSCRLLQRNKIAQLDKITTFLNKKDDGLNAPNQSEGKEEKDDDPQEWNSWLSNCIIAISPAEDLLALAQGKKALFLTKKKIRKTEDDVLQWNEICWKGTLCADDHESVSSLLCLPLASQQRSSQGSPDWSCIIAGFTSGFIRIYMQNGELLISQFLHDSPVFSFSLRTKLVTDSSDQVEELAILYSKAIVVIDGFSLYQSLRACRSQLAKAHASGFQETIEPPALAYRKWKLDGQEDVFDIVNNGLVTPCMFDKLSLSSSQYDGKSLKASASGSRKIISSGRNPFVGWYELFEESTTPLISEVALNVASKLTTAVMSRISSATGDWLGFGNRSNQQRKEISPKTVEPGTNARLRYGLPDKRRRAESIVLSPNDSLAACTDDFGRILLISRESGLVVRMFKGYRDAQCGWLLSTEEQQSDGQPKQNSTHTRHALFLVIYAPRRGILEIWLAEQGSRVSAFTVGKDCRLIYNRYGVLGNSGKHRQDLFKELQHCFLVEGNGIISSIIVPFHCALSLSHSVKMRDGYLLKKISSVMEKSTDPVSDASQNQLVQSITSLFREIDVPASQFMGILRILSCEKLSTETLDMCLSAILAVLSERVKAIGEGGDLEYKVETKSLMLFCSKQLELIALYRSLKELHLQEGDVENFDRNKIQEENGLKTLLKLSEEEMFILQELFNKSRVSSRERSHKSANDLSVIDFLKIFRNPQTESRNDIDLKKIGEISSLDVFDDHSLSNRMATFIYEEVISKKLSVNDLGFLVNSPYLYPDTLMILLATFTLSEEHLQSLDDSTVYYLHSLVYAICHCRSKRSSSDNINASEFWAPVREVLENSTRSSRSLLFAFICRNFSFVMDPSSEQCSKDESGWTDLDKDKEEWNSCICRLMDILAVDNFLQTDQLNLTDIIPIETHQSKLTVKGILNSDQGSITQIMASHLVGRRVPGPCLKSIGTSNNEVEQSFDCLETNNSKLLESIKKLQIRFPCSLETNVLLAHCCWECIILWKNDVEEISNLFSAIVHLSCISNSLLKQGLVLMFWKAVYKESVKNIYHLIEKVGKCPKDRLCRKHTGMSIGAVEKYLLSAQNLLELLFELDFANAEVITVEEEQIWQNKSRPTVTIIDNAFDEPICEPKCAKAIWSVVLTLRLITFAGMKNKRPSEIFDSKAIIALMQAFPMTVLSAIETSDSSITATRCEFCLSTLSLLVAKYSTMDESENEDALMTVANDVFLLSKYFQLEEDQLWQHFTCELFLAGLDSAGLEATLSVHDKESLATPLLECVGSRLAVLLIESADSSTLSTVLSSFPTHITSWLQSQNADKVTASKDTVIKNVNLLNRILSFAPENCRNSKFIADLVESLELLPTS